MPAVPGEPRLAAAGPRNVGSADCAGQTGCRVPASVQQRGSCPRETRAVPVFKEAL